ncbi:hypothetical protein [Thalassobacillus sp. B23F22_16]|uniref:hypothetical protein n=1 Tax=Thalassobacillus sp. B23F22_16 TaxID=3459513 RepID=UPI00373E9AF5
MKQIIYKAREKSTYYLVGLFMVIILMIASGWFTTVSFVWGQRFITLSFIIVTYVLFFLNVDPIKKGVLLALIPALGTIIILVIHDAVVPEGFYPEWLDAETSNPRNGRVSALYMILTFIVLKLSKVKPFIHVVEKREDEKREQKKQEKY